MARALDANPGVEHLMAYEARLNYFISGKLWISICMYNVTNFPDVTILNVLKTRSFIINGGIIMQNQLYYHHDKWLANNAPQHLSRN